MSDPSNVRFTAWLTQEEHDSVRKLAKELNASANYVIRQAVRLYCGELLEVTDVTGNGE